MSIQVGLYRHFKGNPYRVMGFVRHSETMESMVLYQALYGDFGLWIRPTAMFAETVEVDGRTVPRFAYEGTRDPMFHPPEDQA
jgi:hypothetical protein